MENAKAKGTSIEDVCKIEESGGLGNKYGN